MFGFRSFLTFFLLLCSLVSCKKHFAYDVKEIDFVNQSDTMIDGTLVDISLPLGVQDFIMCDSLFMFLVDDPSGQLQVYSANDGRLLGRFCAKGRATFELISPALMSNEVFKDSTGSIILPMRDMRSSTKMVNITESLRRNRATIQDTRNCTSIYYILLDNDINSTLEFFPARYFSFQPDVQEVPYFEIKRKGEVEGTKIMMYPKFMDFEDKSDANHFYHGTLYKHPSRNLVVQPLLGMDYILFMDIDNNKYFAVHQMGSMSFDDYISATYTIGEDESKIMHEGRELPYYFVETFCTESYVMTLYRAGDYCLSFDDEDKACPELIIFDWDGNFIRSVKLAKPVHTFSFDINTNTMYGVDMAEDVMYRFDLTDVITGEKNQCQKKN